jgi:5-methylcytosine-specific restriction endonuclease McrA
MRKKTAERGYDGRWQKAKKTFLQNNPNCRMCMEEGRICRASVVDHIIPHRGDQKLFWDTKNNWQALCNPHHSATKQRIENGKDVKVTGVDGWPIN